MRALVAVFLAVAILFCESPAFAGVGNGNFETDFTATPTPTGVVFEVSAWSDGGSVQIGTNPLEGCVVLGGLTGQGAIDYAGGTGIILDITGPEMATSDATYIFVSCRDRIFNGFNWAVWEQGDPPPPTVIDALAQAARSAIAVPELTPQTAPDGLDTPFLAQLPVWLWIPGSSWVPVSGTASLAGLGLSVTATATPVNTNWITGADVNTSITCGPGTPWSEALDDEATNCSATYTRTTPAGTTIDLTVTTNYDIAFVCTPGLCDPAAINLPGLAITVSRPVSVTEARGLITR